MLKQDKNGRFRISGKFVSGETIQKLKQSDYFSYLDSNNRLRGKTGKFVSGEDYRDFAESLRSVTPVKSERYELPEREYREGKRVNFYEWNITKDFNKGNFDNIKRVTNKIKSQSVYLEMKIKITTPEGQKEDRIITTKYLDRKDNELLKEKLIELIDKMSIYTDNKDEGLIKSFRYSLKVKYATPKKKGRK